VDSRNDNPSCCVILASPSRDQDAARPESVAAIRSIRVRFEHARSVEQAVNQNFCAQARKRMRCMITGVFSHAAARRAGLSGADGDMDDALKSSILSALL
jgi:hypothetical protein